MTSTMMEAVRFLLQVLLFLLHPVQLSHVLRMILVTGSFKACLLHQVSLLNGMQSIQSVIIIWGEAHLLGIATDTILRP